MLSVIALVVIVYVCQTVTRQWIFMSLPLPLLADDENPPSSIIQSTSVNQTSEDLPPTYDTLIVEDTEELPNYKEATQGHTENTTEN